jgi:peptide/nickel transport system permease protein/peptide/nickel transport system substrate-binding protein
MTTRLNRFAINRRSVIAAAAGLALGPTLGRAARAEPVRGGTLRCTVWQTPGTLDPMTGRSGSDHSFLYPMFDTLVDFDPKTMKPMPGLAKAWHYPDPRTLILDLREGVVFHDGTPFDAEAVKANFERSRTSPRSNIRTDFASVGDIEVTSPTRVTLHLNEPDTSLPLTFADRAGMMFSPKAMQQYGAETDTHPVGTGPMKLVSWLASNRVVYARNENYWKKGQPYLDGLTITTVADISTSLRAVVAGEADFVYSLSPQQKPLLDRMHNLGSDISPSLNLVMAYLNYGRKPLDDVRVRQALNFAIDRDALNKAVGLGLNEPTCAILPRDHWACDTSVINAYPYNPQKARELLAAAGYPDGVDLPCLGFPDQNSIQLHEVLLDQAKKAGFRLRIARGSMDDISVRFFGPAKDGDARISAWSGRPDPSQSFQQLFRKQAFYNAGKVDTPGFDEALQITRSTDNLDERIKAFATLEKLVSDQALMWPMMFQPQIVAFNKKVKGYQPNLLGKVKFDGMYIES